MLYIIISIILALVVATFAVQNSMAIDLNFLHWSIPTNLVVVLIVAVLIGIIIAGIWGLKIKTQSYLKARKLQDEITRLNEENATLKTTLAQYLPTKEQDGDNSNSTGDNTAVASPEAVSAKERLVQAMKEKQ